MNHTTTDIHPPRSFRPPARETAMRLWIDAPTATREQVAAGIEALRTFFASLEATPWDCAAAAFQEEGEGCATARESELANASYEASEVALKAVFGWEPARQPDDDGDGFTGRFTMVDHPRRPNLELAVIEARQNDSVDWPRLDFTI
jgi:hypothetical protein